MVILKAGLVEVAAWFLPFPDTQVSLLKSSGNDQTRQVKNRRLHKVLCHNTYLNEMCTFYILFYFKSLKTIDHSLQTIQENFTSLCPSIFCPNSS